MKGHTSDRGSVAPLGQRVDPVTVTSPAANDSGIEVHEEEWGTVFAQPVFKMRCECGRSWFELELKQFVECPACRRLCLVFPA